MMSVVIAVCPKILLERSLNGLDGVGVSGVRGGGWDEKGSGWIRGMTSDFDWIEVDMIRTYKCLIM